MFSGKATVFVVVLVSKYSNFFKATNNFENFVPDWLR
jgi:uncharacterized membrane protein YqhA